MFEGDTRRFVRFTFGLLLLALTASCSHSRVTRSAKGNSTANADAPLSRRRIRVCRTSTSLTTIWRSCTGSGMKSAMTIERSPINCPGRQSKR